MAKLSKMIKDLIFFNEPEKVEEFVLKENENNKGKNTIESPKKEPDKKKKNEGGVPRRLFSTDTDEKKENDSKKDDKSEKSEISKSLSENLEYMKKIYSIPTNGDMILREFDIAFKDKVINAFILFFDGMVDRQIINHYILQPLMLLSTVDIKDKEEDVAEYITKHLIPQHQLKVVGTYSDVIGEINFGGCAIFVDGVDVVFAADVKGWEHRNVERPNTELVIRGPQEGFNEILRVNTALVRKILKDESLIVENIPVGRKSKTPCSLMYIKDIANDSLVQEIRRRLNGIKLDYIMDSGELEQLIEDSTFLPAPQVIATERPDRVASMLSEGKVAIVVHGSPFVLVMPVTLPTLIKSPEDAYIRFPYANLLRAIRIIGIIFSLLLPGLYVAITNFHHEMIPTDLLFAIEASRERVPFPSVIEILIMELSFELIREAGIRIPGPIGPTLGIIGALILGQAAVAANIVSPILIIIVAVTGIGSFAIPNFSLGLAFRTMRFGYIVLGAMAGFLGITVGLFMHGIWLVSAKSFGVPFLSPYGPRTAQSLINDLTRAPMWMQERRPDYLNTKDEKKQPEISRAWIKGKENGDNNGGK